VENIFKQLKVTILTSSIFDSLFDVSYFLVFQPIFVILIDFHDFAHFLVFGPIFMILINFHNFAIF